MITTIIEHDGKPTILLPIAVLKRLGVKVGDLYTVVEKKVDKKVVLEFRFAK